ncbi:hypothetical protein FOCG_13863 [Fusarium oxysporum f. sp. radicis-lycopersici 26381]|nr:hypothetical protein FOCG_13863 [Fusarium oxysporum f. sp. radicis-lycopersici 26381]
MSAPRSRQRLGLHQIVPSPDSVAGHTTIDIIAIHGLGTESPRTWEFKRSEGRVVNWLADEDMLPATVPEARIFTYDWNANYFQDAPVQTLLGHADTLLAHIAETRDVKSRPIIFIASCFGGLVLIEAINRAGQEGSPYRHVLLSTVGIVFLATPFNGADASREARWQVVVGGIMGEDTSDELIKDLERKHDLVHRRVQKFTEIANADAIRLHLYCFFETKKTEILRRVFPSNWARRFSTRFTHKILVTESSACLLGFPSLPLDVTHSGMNKFDGPGNSCYKLVKDQIRRMANDAWTALNRRQSCKVTEILLLIGSDQSLAPRQHWMVPFDRNEGFVGREDVLRLLLDRISPSANKDACQRTVIQGLGGIGKTQIALEAGFRLRDADPSCSVFWVPAVDATTFENAYRDIGQRLGVAGLDDDKADVKALVQAAMSRDDTDRWLLIIDNADDLELMFGSGALAQYLPCSTNGSILFTTRTREVTNQLDIYATGIIELTKMKREEAREMLQARLREDQVPDRASTDSLLDFLDDLPLAIRQASAYMFKTGISTARYLEYCLSSDATLVKLLSREFEDRGRYDRIKNPVATTWLISFKHISRDNLRAGEYLEFMCFLAERDIPISLLPSASDEMETEEAVGMLEAYGFIMRREEGESLDMHRLVRLAMWNWLRQEGQARQRYCDVVRRLDEVFPFPEHENREIWMRYMAHAQRVVESDEECEDEEAMSGLLFNVAEALSMQGRYEGAAKLYRETLEVREKVGKEHPDTLSVMNNLASVLDNMGEYEEAEKMHRETLELMEKVLGKEHPSTLGSMNNLASVLGNMGEYEEAEKMHRETLELMEKVLGKEHPSTLDSMNNLANRRWS